MALHAPHTPDAAAAQNLKFGFVVPYAAERDFLEFAQLGEQRGWDGVFGWESLYGIHAWVELGAAAMVTEKIRLGTMLTPASRHRPWDLASMVGTVDRISNGRAVMAVGLGAVHDGWTAFEPDEGRAARAKKLDECLTIYAGLIDGDPSFAYTGEHYSVKASDFARPEVTPQRPHPPVWAVAAATPGRARQPSLERAARLQGAIPSIHGEDEDAPRRLEDFVEIADRLRELRDAAGLPWDGYDLIIEADSYGNFTSLAPADQQAWAQAGATWWIESWWDLPAGEEGLAEVRRRIDLGPPQSR